MYVNRGVFGRCINVTVRNVLWAVDFCGSSHSQINGRVTHSMCPVSTHTQLVRYVPRLILVISTWGSHKRGGAQYNNQLRAQFDWLAFCLSSVFLADPADPPVLSDAVSASSSSRSKFCWREKKRTSVTLLKRKLISYRCQSRWRGCSTCSMFLYNGGLNQ